MSEKKSVLITGASSGIGEAAARYLDSVGYQVILVARQQEKLEGIATELSNSPLYIPYNLQDLEHIEDIFKQCKSANLRLYGLVHCAGINRDQPVKTNSLNDMFQVMGLNLMSFIELSKYFCRKKYSEDGGAIIAMSSMAALECAKGMCTYSASKAGIDAAARVMSREFARRKIRVNTIQPSMVDTAMARSAPEFEGKFAAQPLGVIEPVYIAYLIAFLLSEQAKYISGSNIKVSSAV